MAEKVKIWFDAEGDFLEVRFSDAPGYMKETNHDAVMERVDEQGKVIGFSVLGVSRIHPGQPIEVELVTACSCPFLGRALACPPPRIPWTEIKLVTTR